MRRLPPTLRDESGVALPLVALMILALFGVAALAVDHGMGRKARFEAQAAADASALAGVSGYLDAPPDDHTLVYGRAREFAGLNSIMNVAIDPTDADQVQIDLLANQGGGEPDPNGVRSTIRRRAVPTWFARVLGINTVDIEAAAEARLTSTSRANCFKPFAIPDDEYGPEDAGNLVLIWSVGDPALVLVGVDANGPAGLGNLAPYVSAKCPGNTNIVIGEEVMPAAPDNNRNGQIRNGMNNMLACDPSLVYTEGVGLTRWGVYDPDWRESCRVGTVALYDATTYDPSTGTDDITITNFATVYFSHATGQAGNPNNPYKVWGRIFPYVGRPDQCQTEGNCAPNAFAIRLTG